LLAGALRNGHVTARRDKRIHRRANSHRTISIDSLQVIAISLESAAA
jgi:hypothetical protein